MSAILGVANFNKKSIDKSVVDNIINPLKKYKIDNYKDLIKDNVYMGCGIQYITEESKSEILPYYDEEAELVITADAIIDNREELIKSFDIDKNRIITDSELILSAYKKWGHMCVNHLIGDFSFVIWDEKEEELFCVRDHTGKRTFYYYKSDDVFSFSTIIMPLVNCMKEKPNLNDRWIADYLALTGVLHEDECEETLYKDVYQIPPAHYLVVAKDKFEFTEYWNPLKTVKKLKLNSDDDYNNEFKKVFYEAVNCRLRCASDVAVSVSGGLDSTAVAAVAAETLKKQGKVLKGFTTVPMEGYKDYLPKMKVADERVYVEALKEAIGNFEVNYCDYKGKDALTDIDKIIDVLEQPHKLVENMVWVNEIMELSAKNNCRVLLNGQNGNCNISYGNFLTYAKTLFYKGKLIKLGHEMKAFRVKRSISRKIVIKGVLKAIKPVKYAKLEPYRNTSFLKDELYEKLKLAERFENNRYLNKNDAILDEEEMKYFLIHPVAFSHLAHIETKLGLYNGIIKRDPTRDIRLIEFCLSLPYDQFVRDGEERYLIRRAMKGIVPDCIRLNFERRGLQSADWLQRLQLRWPEVREDIQNVINENINNKYLDMKKIKAEFMEFGESINEDMQFKIRNVLVAYIFIKYFNNYSKVEI